MEELFLIHYLFEFCIRCMFYFQKSKRKKKLTTTKENTCQVIRILKFCFSYVGNQSHTKMSDSIGNNI